MLTHFFNTEGGAPFWAQLLVVLAFSLPAGVALAKGIWQLDWRLLVGSGVTVTGFMLFLFSTSAP